MFYHLGELDDALTYALGAGSQFNIADNSEYVQTILGMVVFVDGVLMVGG